MIILVCLCYGDNSTISTLFSSHSNVSQLSCASRPGNRASTQLGNPPPKNLFPIISSQCAVMQHSYATPGSSSIQCGQHYPGVTANLSIETSSSYVTPESSSLQLVLKNMDSITSIFIASALVGYALQRALAERAKHERTAERTAERIQRALERVAELLKVVSRLLMRLLYAYLSVDGHQNTSNNLLLDGWWLEFWELVLLAAGDIERNPGPITGMDQIKYH